MLYSQDSDGRYFLTTDGKIFIQNVLHRFNDQEIRSISGVSKSALHNYNLGRNAISSRGRVAIDDLEKHLKNIESKSTDNIDTTVRPDAQPVNEKDFVVQVTRLILHAKKFGYQLTLTAR